MPGIYFEKIGVMNQVEFAWKLVIKLDVGALEIRFQQFQDYTNQMENLSNLDRERPIDVYERPTNNP